MSMHILQLVKHFESEIGRSAKVGGVERVVKMLVDGLLERGYEVSILTSSTERTWRDRASQYNDCHISKVATPFRVAGLAVSPGLPLEFRRTRDTSDVVHFHMPSPMAEAGALIGGIPSDTGVIVTVHADPASTRYSTFKHVYTPIMRRILRRADVIVVTSDANRKMEFLARFEQKVRVIPLPAAIDGARFRQRESIEDLRRRTGRELGLRAGKTLIFVGRLVYYKGLDHLIAAIEHLDVDLLIVGEGPERERLQAMAHDLGIAGRIRFCGFVSDDELQRWYMAADLFVLPSTRSAEAYGIVQVEAMSFGLPVINTALPTGVPEVSRNGETGITVRPADVSGLSNAIKSILENEELRRRFQENALRRAQELSAESMTAQYIHLYQSIVRKSGPTPPPSNRQAARDAEGDSQEASSADTAG